MKHLKSFNESLDNEINTNLIISGRESFSSPTSTPSLNLKVIQKQLNYKDVGNKKSIMFQTNESGVIIGDVNEIEKIIEFLMEYKDSLY